MTTPSVGMPDCAFRPTGVDWDRRITAALYALSTGERTVEETQDLVARLVGWREQHEKIVTRANSEREPDLTALILEREGGRR